MRRPLWIVLLVAGLFAPAAPAQTYTWTGTTGNLNDPTKWTGGIAPTGGGMVTDSLQFGGSVAYTATNSATATQLPLYYASNITFNNTSGGVTLTATGITFTQMGFQIGGLSQSGGSLTQSGAGPVSITAPIYYRHNDGSPSTLLAVNVNAGAGQLTVGAAGNTNSVFRGANGVFFNNLSSNAIQIGNLSRLGGGISVFGTVTQLAGVGGGVGRDEGGYSSLTVNGSSTLTLNDYGSDGTPWGGFNGLTLNATGTINGNVQLSGGGTTSGTTSISGTLNGSLRLFSTGGTFSGSQAAAGKRLDLHASTLTVTGTFAASAGVQVDSGGSLTASGNERLAVGTSGVLQLAGGSLTLTGAASANVTQTFATAGALSLVSTQGYSGLNTLTATAGSGGTATIAFGTAGGNAALAAGTLTGPGTLRVVTNTGGAVQFFNTALTNGILGGGVVVNNGGLEWATLSGSNVVALATYQTGTNPNTWAATDNVKVSAALSANLTASSAVNTLHLASTNALTLNAGTTLTLNAGGVIANTGGVGNNVNITGGTLTTNTATAGNFLRFNLNNSQVTVFSVVANQGANPVGVVVSGSGILNLYGANTFTGDVHVQGNAQLTVSPLGGANSLGNSSRVFLTRGSMSIAADMTMPQVIDVGSGTGTLLPSFATVTLSAANPLQGTNRGALTIQDGNSGTSTVILSNADGGVANLDKLTIGNNVTLRLGTRTTGASLLGASTSVYLSTSAVLDGSYGNTTAVGAVDGLSSGTFRIRGGNTLTVGATDRPGAGSSGFAGAFIQAIDGVATGTAANLVKVGLGTQNLYGASSYTGTTTVLSGTLGVGANVAVSANGPVGNAASAVLLGNTTGTDDATLLLQSGFTFARPVTVQAGSTGLVAISGQEFSSGTATFSGPITLNRTVEAATPGGSLVFSGVVSGVGGVVKAGNGTLTVTGNNTYAGPTIVGEGTLLVNGQTGSNSGTGTGGVTVLSNATLGGNGRLAPSGANTVLVRGGTITAGTGVGASTLTVGSNGLTTDGGAYLVKLFDTGYTNPGTADISKLSVTGNVTIGATSLLRLDLSALSAAQVATLRAAVGIGNTRVYTVVEGSGTVNNFAAGNFSVLALGNFTAGEWTLRLTPTTSTVQLNFTPVPEPGVVFGVAAVALAAAAGVRRFWRW